MEAVIGLGQELDAANPGRKIALHTGMARKPGRLSVIFP